MNRSAPPAMILSVRSASKVYRMGEIDVPALRDASIDIHDGEFLIIVGPSGSGKTTLLNLIGGMDRPTSGTVRFLDQDLSAASDRQLTLYRRAHVGFVFQFFNLASSLTALENVEVAAAIAPDPMDPLEALRLVGLEERAGSFPSQLSGGEQQRVAIARALAGNPRLLLCDEPTGALDLDTSRQALGLLVQLNRNLSKTVVLITHNNAIAELGDRVALMRDGAIRGIRVNERPTPVGEITW
ncbi:MAG: ABC transporter ATP-binding protein [Candidatus Sumerlaeota bacterium]|nr:ABC transporter ATP-binding protein [Candidatus Sumerlaeota bacterium]